MMPRKGRPVLFYLLAIVLGEPQGNAQILVEKETRPIQTDTLEQLFSDYFEWKLRTYPEWATKEGFKANAKKQGGRNIPEHISGRSDSLHIWHEAQRLPPTPCKFPGGYPG